MSRRRNSGSEEALRSKKGRERQQQVSAVEIFKAFPI